MSIVYRIQPSAAMSKYFLSFCFLLCVAFTQAQLYNRSKCAALYYVQPSQIEKYFLEQDDGAFISAITELPPIDTLCNKGYYELSLPSRQGTYVMVWANNNKLQWKIYFQNEMEYELFPVGSDVLVYLYNRYTLEPINNATVKKENQVARYDKHVHGYKLNFKKSENGDDIPLLIDRNGQLLLINLSRAQHSNNVFRRYWQWLRYAWRNYDSRQSTHYGYLALNKPKFRVGDTLKFKAFVLNKKGRPTKNMGLELRYHDHVKRRYVQKSIENLNHYREGAFSGSFVIPDSLEGKNLNLIVATSNGITSGINSSFVVEDYRLDEVDFNARILNEDESFYSNQPLIFEFTAEDDNGLPVLDGRVNIEITGRRVSRDSIFEQILLPNILLDTTIVLDAVGPTIFKFYGPKSHPATYSFNVNVSFQNSENETHHHNFLVKYKSIKLPFKVEKGEKGFYLIPNDSTIPDDIAEVRIKAFKGLRNDFGPYSAKNDTLLFEKNVHYHHYEPFYPTIDYYLIEWKNGFEQRVNIPYPEGIPTLDSTKAGRAYIYFERSDIFPVLYRLYNDKRQQITSGKAQGDTLFINSMETDYVVVEYQYIGERYQEREILPLKNIYENPIEKLHLDITGPLKIRPGEMVTWDLEVTDKQGGVQNLDIVGFSKKKSFENKAYKERLPYTKYNQKIRLGKDVQLSSKVNKGWDQMVPLTKGAFQYLGLSSQPCYKYLFRDEAIIIDTFKISEKTSCGQLAAFIYNGTEQQSIYYILANGRPIYAYNLANEKFSFPIKPGTYNLEIRCRDFSIAIKDVTVYKNNKTEVAINLEKVTADILVTARPPYFTENEFRLISAHALYNQTMGYQQYIAQGDNYITKNQKFAGPFEKGEMVYWSPTVDTMEFYFEPGHAYHFSPNRVKVSDTIIEYSRSFLPATISGQGPGQVLLPKVPFVINNNKPLYIENLPDENRGEAQGTMYLWNNTDSSFIYYQLYHYEKDSLFFGKPNYRSLWPVGNYRLQAYTAHNTVLVLDSLKIAEKSTTYIFLESFLFERNRYIKNRLSSTDEKTNPGVTENTLYLKGKIINHHSSEALPFANILVKSNGKLIAMGVSKLDGTYVVSLPSEGRYDVGASLIGFVSNNQNQVTFDSTEDTLELNIRLSGDPFVIEELTLTYEAALIDKSSSAMYFQAEEIRELAVRGLSSESALIVAPGVQADDVYFVNGVKMRSNVNVPMAAISSYEVISGGLPAQYGDAVGGIISGTNPMDAIDDDKYFHNSTKGKNLPTKLQGYQGGLRTNFSDYAFFIPNITTDENGEAKISVQYPDDVNAWTTTFIGLGEDFKYFKAEVNTQSFSEVTARLATPSYLRLGDSCVVIGKVLNYLDTNLVVKSIFEVNSAAIMDSLRPVKNAIIDKLPVVANSDSIALRYTLELPDGYLDGEERTIPIIKGGMGFSKGGFIRVDKDTLIEILNLDKEIYTITILSSGQDVLLKLAEDLYNYEYECNEQLASKLLGLLAQQQIMVRRGERFRGGGEIERIISKLLKAKNNLGLWGWWPNQQTDIFMTTYVCEALQQALSAGFDVSGLKYSLDALENSLLNTKPNRRVAQLYCLYKSNLNVGFKFFMRDIRMDSLTISEKLKLAIIAEGQNQKYDSKEIDKLLKTDMLGNKYVDEQSKFSLTGSFYNMRLMAEWLEIKGRSTDVEALQDYALAQVNLYNLNTIEKAAAIRILAIGNQQQAEGLVKVEFNGKSIPVEGESLRQIKSDKDSLKLNIETEKFLYISYSYKHLDSNPKANKENFDISTTWLDKDVAVESISAGKTMTMKVKVDATKKADYVMVMVPKPSGVVYIPNRRGAYNSFHIEEKMDHLNLYLNSLPEGVSEFELEFNPRFEGSYVLDPVKVEMMYFPVFYGNNETKRVLVK